MGRMVGTVTRGILSPIFKQGDDIVKIVTDTVINASAAEGFEIRDRDIIAITESVIARAQGNYAQVDDIAEDVRKKFGKSTIGIIFPILSRNRFALCLKGIAKGAEKIELKQQLFDLYEQKTVTGSVILNPYETKIYRKKRLIPKAINGLSKNPKQC
jgi:hypothetical protein